MASSTRSSEDESDVQFLKTCQTCFNAKIKCIRTRHARLCDRCLRLGKPCHYSLARRRRHPSRQRDSRSLDSCARGASGAHEPIRGASLGFGPDPVSQGLVSLVSAESLLVYFKSKMIPYFPFVLLPADISVAELRRKRPYVLVAILAAASFDDNRMQEKLSLLMNQSIASYLISGSSQSLDLLQGVLIHLAWAHYHPHAQRYTQYLHIAISIVSDMRLDRPRRPKLWDVNGGKERDAPDWGLEEMRALAGTYYLASSSSILLQKSRHFLYNPYISECCEHLAIKNEYPTDQYLRYIIQVQKLNEEIEESLSKTSSSSNPAIFFAESQNIAEKHDEIKSSLTFPLSESPPLLLQFYMLELVLSQSSPQGSPFGLDRFHNQRGSQEDESSLLKWLTSSISAVRSLITFLLVMPKGEETALSNIAWITLYCGLSLAVRLDVVLRMGRVPDHMTHLRDFSDMPHTLRQIILRLEPAVPSEEGSDAQHRPFDRLVKRVRRLQAWHAKHSKESMSESYADMLPPLDPLSTSGGTWSAMPWGSSWPQGPGMDFGAFIFSDPAAQNELPIAWDADEGLEAEPR